MGQIRLGFGSMTGSNKCFGETVKLSDTLVKLTVKLSDTLTGEAVKLSDTLSGETVKQ